MGDVDFNDADQAEQPVQEKRKLHFPVLRVLMIIGIAIAGSLLVFFLSWLAMQALDKKDGSSGGTGFDLSEAYMDVPPEYAYYNGIDDISTRTIDNPPASVGVKVLIGYDKSNKALENEFTARKDQIKDFLRQYFSKKTAEELSPTNEDRVKTEIKEQLNNRLRAKGVRDILFDKYNVMEQ